MKSFALFIFLLPFCFCDSIGRFWHLTDLHYSPAYKPGSNSLRRCMSGHGNAGKYGSTPICDTPLETIESALSTMVSLEPKPDFVLYTGDMAPHHAQGDAKEISIKDVLTYEHNVTMMLDKYFAGVPSYPIFGNHDTYPRFSVFANESYWLYTSLAKEWEKYYTPQARDTIAKGGYFKEEIMPGILLVSINTNLYYTGNHEDDVSVNDPLGQFNWLSQTLAQAKSQQKKVIIAIHVPIGYSGKLIGQLNEPRNDQIVDVLSPYMDIIVAIFAGHNHIDSFHIVSGQAGSTVQFLAPSINEFGFAYPRVRLFEYQKNPFKILNYTNYVMDLKKSNKDQVPYWTKEYSFTELYGVKDLSIDSIFSAWEKIRDDETAFKNYMKYWKGVHFVGQACSFFDFCHRETYCSIRNIRLADLKQCVKDDKDK